jgi:hypothetical protein
MVISAAPEIADLKPALGMEIMRAMAETASKPALGVVAVLVIGTCHEYQRHQDANAGRERVRNDFEQVIRAAIAERAISLIAEEAGKKEEVHARLKADEAKTSAFDVLFADARVTDEPQDTIAKLVADELLGGNHIDVRPPNAEKMTVAERDKAMAAKTMESLGSATSVLVICGERHRAGVTAHLTNYGLRGESQPFPDQCEDKGNVGEG